MRVVAFLVAGSILVTDAFTTSRIATTTTTTTQPKKNTFITQPFSSQPSLYNNRYRTVRTFVSSQLFASTSSNNNNNAFDEECDVLVLGSGPAARAIASLLSSDGSKLDIILADQRVDIEWAPNYGVWQDEWQYVVNRYKQQDVALTGGKVGQSIDREWPVTDCYFGGSFGKDMKERMRLDRPYCRVDRTALRESLTTNYRMLRANHVVRRAVTLNVYEPAGSLVHDATGSTIQLEQADGSGIAVRAKLIVDCTGHETKLIVREPRDHSIEPGYQIAYGVLVDLEEDGNVDHVGPYDKEAMTLFDYRTDHFATPTEEEKASKAPTFMYAMPLYDNCIFFEETSLVARPAVSFQECKERCIKRLQYLGIKVKKVREEEFCYIPMGGALPARDQRVIALGGAAAMVHPSTGYHLCRAMTGAADVAEVIRKELVMGSDDSKDMSLDRTAAMAYHALWTPENIRQRNFAVFGGEFLMKQNVEGLRGFFDGFFRLPLPLWAGFLAGWPGLPNNENHESWFARMWFGLNFIVRIPFPVAFDMFLNIVSYSITEGVPLPQSVTPFLGAPKSYEYQPKTHAVGDVAAKQEARRMIETSRVTPDIPNSFVSSYGTTPGDASRKIDISQEFAAGTGASLGAVGGTARVQPKEDIQEAIKN